MCANILKIRGQSGRAMARASFASLSLQLSLIRPTIMQSLQILKPPKMLNFKLQSHLKLPKPRQLSISSAEILSLEMSSWKMKKFTTLWKKGIESMILRAEQPISFSETEATTTRAWSATSIDASLQKKASLSMEISHTIRITQRKKRIKLNQRILCSPA